MVLASARALVQLTWLVVKIIQQQSVSFLVMQLTWLVAPVHMRYLVSTDENHAAMNCALLILLAH